jgi:hypothetical protein
MTLWNPDWAVEVNGLGDVTNLVLSDLTITSGRTDIYSLLLDIADLLLRT